MTWERAWQEGRTRWDAGASPPALHALVASHASVERALVPGCGSGYDVFTLAKIAKTVIGLDVVDLARDRFETLRDEHGVAATRAAFVVDDFFTYTPEAPFDIIWDYTFLCALDPSEREAWADRIDTLLADDGELWTLIFPVHPVPLNPGGPPHPMTPELVRGLLEPRFEAVHLAPVLESHPGREGKEWLGRWRRTPAA